ncbi:MAG: DNA-binding transcriptional LysR family regulator [Myxococcota bacterium]|jgi:DNA-binding transcriptional LysR family regulator
MSGADELAVFVKVVEEGSFTAAAHALSMPKSSISRNIARLEDRLGVRLLHRTTRSLSTTEAGVRFYTRCVRIVADIAEAEASLAARPTPRGPLSLSAPPLLSPWLSPILCDFLTAWPEVQLALSSDPVADLVISEQVPDDAHTARRLPGTERVLCASPAYLARCLAPAAPDALQDHACLMAGERTEGTWALGDGSIVPVSGPLASSDATTLTTAALAGLGIAWLPRVVIAEALAGGGLVELLAAHTLAAPPLLVTTLRPSIAADTLVDLLGTRL